ncbi:MAG: polyprenol phosphomannose-dependent alpha 1,6 mannosyltransferase MptB [Actinomycetota bacterium]|nr:polyprenol phosphomannose-dependent alpha 1,6 mannosyltransferase MptB [Actinomycetota bacterium]
MADRRPGARRAAVTARLRLGRDEAAVALGDPLRTWVLVGMVGATLVALGGGLAGAGAPRTPGSRLLWSVPAVASRPDLDLVVMLTVFYGGLVVLTRSWLGLRGAVARSGAPPVAVMAVVVLWALPFVLGPPLASRDVYSYAAVGELARSGLDPYELGPSALADDELIEAVDPVWRDSPTPYGPAFLALAERVVWLGGEKLTAVVMMFRVVALVGVAVAAWALPRLARSLGRDPADAVVLAVANPLVLVHLVSGAHNEALMVGLLMAGVVIGRQPGWRHAGVMVVALAGAIKAPALLGVAYLGWTEVDGGSAARVRTFATAGLVAAGTLAATSALSGHGWGWLHTVGGSTDLLAYLALSNLVGLVVGVLGSVAGFALDVDRAVDLARSASIVVVAVVVAALLFHTNRRRQPGALGAALLVVALLGPVTQPWYLTWGLVLSAAALGGRHGRWFVVLSIVMAFATLPIGPGLGLELRPVAAVVPFAVLALVPLTFRRVTPPGHRPLRNEVRELTVVVPTRNEAGNVGPLLHRLDGALAGVDAEVIVVDDSDDDTCDRLADAAPGVALPVRLLHRRGNERWGGLSSAVVEGIEAAEGRWVAVIDGDLQHPPEVVRDMLERTHTRACDLVVGSRFVPGGDAGGLSPLRRRLSAAATLTARGVLGPRLAGCTDPMSGLFLVRRSMVDTRRCNPSGFKILLELLATQPGLRRVEVPLRFAPRTEGRSKASVPEALGYLGHVLDLRIRTLGPWTIDRSRTPAGVRSRSLVRL